MWVILYTKYIEEPQEEIVIGKRVRKRRRDLDMTQVELAAKSGLAQFHISLIEKEHVKNIQTDTLKKLALALDVSADWLIDLQGVASGSDSTMD
jgi:transcriptional regulator with XRE-family HTH domain